MKSFNVDSVTRQKLHPIKFKFLRQVITYYDASTVRCVQSQTGKVKTKGTSWMHCLENKENRVAVK